MTGHPVYAPILVAWARGPSADLLAGLSSTVQVDRALDALTRLLGEPRALIDRQLVTWATQDWAADPFARGAYSYVRAGGMEVQVILASPMEYGRHAVFRRRSDRAGRPPGDRGRIRISIAKLRDSTVSSAYRR